MYSKKKSKKWLWIAVIVVVLGAAGAAFAFGGNDARPEEVAVVKGTVVETVSVTGRVKPASLADLAFERTGKVARVAVKVGDRVNAGTVLVELEAADLRADLREAEAQVATEQANLEKLRLGMRPEEIAVKVAELAKAEQDLANYYTGALTVVEDAYAKADDAVRAKTDPLFSNDDGDSPSFTFTVSDFKVQIEAVDLRRQAGKTLTAWDVALRAVRASTTPSAMDTLLEGTAGYLALVRDFLARALDAVNASTNLDAATVDAYKTAIATGRTNTAAAITAVSSATQNLAAQALVVAKARSELVLARSGATAEELAAEEAKVLQAEARREAARAALAKTTITTPFTGLVTKQEATVGEIVAANETLVSLIGERSLEVEAFIPEVDVGKVSVGDVAMVTFDSYGAEEVFTVRVARIEPAETVVEGVATYRTIFHFSDTESDVQTRAKSGMTANVEIETDRKEQVLTVPFRALRGKNGGWVVSILNANGTSVERAVTIGLRGTDGMVEIMEGLKEGERIVATPPRE